MVKIPPLMLLPPVVFAALAAVFVWGMARDNPDELPSAFVGRAAPAVVLTQLGEGAPFTDATLRDGKVKIVNFWASWCAPCRAEHPNLMALAEGGLPLYGVNYKDRPQAALRFLEEVGDPFTAIGADESGRMGIDWGLYGVPETFVIDGEGKVLLRFAGPVTERVLQAEILPVIDAAKVAQAAD